MKVADTLPAAPGLPEADARQRAKIEKTAQKFEATFIAQMLGPMFEDMGKGEFGGGEGEDAFKSFLVDAVSQQMARAGGLGLADDLKREMLKMQGLK